MTSFAQPFNICSSKFERRTVPIASPGYAPGNSYCWPYGFVLILLLRVQTPRQCSELITTFTNFLGFNQLKITYLQTQKDKVIHAQ